MNASTDLYGVKSLIESAAPNADESANYFATQAYNLEVQLASAIGQAHGWRAFSLALLGIVFCLVLWGIGRGQ